MSDVLFAAAVAQRAGTDVETTDRVIASMCGLIREMALAGSGVKLTGVGEFHVPAARATGAPRPLAFKPVAKLSRIQAS